MNLTKTISRIHMLGCPSKTIKVTHDDYSDHKVIHDDYSDHVLNKCHCWYLVICLTLVYRLESVEKEEEGFLAGLKIPAPWASGKAVESIHPVRDNYKFKGTVHIPGARCLYLRFDPRCSSQYDYDKVRWSVDAHPC